MAVVVGVVVAVLITTVITMAAWSLSADQVAQRDLGRYNARIDSAAALAPGDGRSLDRAAGDLGPSGALVLQSNDIKPTRSARGLIAYVETDWTRSPFPGCRLAAGRWPQRSNEVVLVGPLASAYSIGDNVSILSGLRTLTVVGIGNNDYAGTSQILAAPGTWQALPPHASRAREGMSASVAILTASPQVSASARILRATLHQPVAVTYRTEVAAERSWIQQSPYSTVLPLLMLPALASGFAAAALGRRSRRFVKIAASVGMSRRQAGRVVFYSLAIMAAAGIAVGAVIGTILGLLGRAAVATFSHQAAGTPPNVIPSLALILVGTVAGLGATLVVTRPPERSRSVSPDVTTGEEPSRSATGRHWAALATFGLSAFVFFRVHDARSAMILGGILLVTVLLFTPEIVAAAARVVPDDHPAPRLARRLVTRNEFGAAAGAALLIVLVTLPLTTAILLTASGTSTRSSLLATAGPGQIAINGRGGIADSPPPEAVRVLKAELPDDFVATEVSFSPNSWYDVPNGNSLVAAVPSTKDVQRIWGRPLTPSQRKALERGGALVWQSEGTFLVNDQRVGPAIPPSLYQPSEEWQNITGAVLLTSAARTHQIKLQPGALILSDVDSSEVKRLVTALTDHHLDPNLVNAYHPPTELVPPAPLVGSAVLLTLLMLAATYVANRSQARSMRTQFGRLIAIGAAPSFVRHSYLLGQLVTSAVSLAVGIAITAVTAATLVNRAPGVEIDPPWTILLISLAAYLIATIGSGLTGLRKIQPTPARRG